MADSEDGEVTAPRGNEWEVVSLTASAYAAAPGPSQVLPTQDSQGQLGGENESETSSPMFMSGHFVFPPSQHENLPVEPEYTETQSGKGIEDHVSEFEDEAGISYEKEGKSAMKDYEHMSVHGFVSDEFPGIQIIDEKGSSLSAGGADFGNDVPFDKEHSIYSTAELSSFLSEGKISRSKNVGEGEGTDDSVEGDKYDGDNLPCEAWWRRRALALYSNAKEANTFWSIFVAAAVMGLVIIGHRWQQERWQILHLRWQFGINEERIGRMFGPISRFKDAIVGGHRRGSLLRGSTSVER